MTRVNTAITALACCLALLALPSAAHERSDVPPGAANDIRQITIELKDAAVENVVASFGQITGFEIAVVLGVELDREVTVSMQDTPWPEVLSKVLAQVDLSWVQVDDYIIVRTR